MRSILRVVLCFVSLIGPWPAVAAADDGPSAHWAAIVKAAGERFGGAGERAASFLAEHRPPRDDAVDPEVVFDAIGVALKARETYPWAKGVPDDLFFNDVVPYAVLDEPRAAVRSRVYGLAGPIVKDATTAAEAAQALNRDLFNAAKVKYSTQRRRANQNPLESMEQGLASCTGLSILLVEACRSVGIPARVAGVASWAGRDGNHTWVEVHDGERWRFTGAAEHDPAGLDRGWFTGAAAGGVEGHARYAVVASSWRTTGTSFPLAWSPRDPSVPGVDVTARYAAMGSHAGGATVGVRLWASRGGSRLAAEVVVSARAPGGDPAEHRARTFADPDDINRLAEVPADAFASPPAGSMSFTHGGEARTMPMPAAPAGGRVIEVFWDELPLSEDAAKAQALRSWLSHADAHRDACAADLAADLVKAAGHEMRLLRREFGEAPEGGRSLWISLHGGGGAPAEVNERQWKNQIRLYEPAEGIVVAPRAPSDTWNLWHRPEVDALLARLIESAVIVWNVNPDRVYLMGYSAGGDGVYQLAPRLADRFAAAAMMAGHPNDASPIGLRNLPFAIFMGGNDAAYNRNAVARQWGERLAQLAADDPGGYPHRVTIYPDAGHWMNGKDAEALPWMAGFSRHPWPRRVVWRQGNTPHERFYWLAVDPADATPGREIRAAADGQTITLEADGPLAVELLLHDDLIDLDQPVRVTANRRAVFEGVIPRTEQAIRRSLARRPDPAMAATAAVRVTIPRAEPAEPADR
ncbi:MAG: dienelactone hydrolase family protein [Phycisphaeraceae bacterium]|nr:MAG: dienelactone hydrolase family protein [Phycisphaeraceae bacterium]